MLFNAVRNHFSQVERLSGIGGAQLWALSVIDGSPGVGVGELAEAMDVHQSTASNIVRALIARGFIASSRRIDDRRAIALSVTDAGRRLLQCAPRPFSGILPDALAKMDPGALSRLEKDLAVLLQMIEGDERDAHIPLGRTD